MSNRQRIIVDHYGVKISLAKVIEELGELATEVSLALAGQLDSIRLKDEVVDCYVMLNSLCLLYNFKESEIRSGIDYKVDRQIGRIEKEKKLSDE